MNRAVALRARTQRGGVYVERSMSGIVDGQGFDTWESLADWLVRPMPDTIQVVFELQSFTEAILSLIPKDKMEEINTNARAIYGKTKIFSTAQMVAVTVWTKDKYNAQTTREVSIYGLNKFTFDTPAPDGLNELEKLGNEVLDILRTNLKIEPTKLTSPAGLVEDKLYAANVPTIWTRKDADFDMACKYALRASGAQWYQDFATEQGEVYNYDLVSAYPSVIRNLPDTDNAVVTHSTTPIRCQWAVAKGTLEITQAISPVPSTDDKGLFVFGKTGTFPDSYITSEEAAWLKKYNVGSFKMDDGYFFTFKNGRKPFAPVMDDLFAVRKQTTGMAAAIAKNMGQGVSGKLDQRGKDKKYGRFFNSVLALMLRSRTRLQVGSFIYDNGLQDGLIKIVLDEVKSHKKIELPNTGEIGTWRIK
jgi:hypothetical protein